MGLRSHRHSAMDPPLSEMPDLAFDEFQAMRQRKLSAIEAHLQRDMSEAGTGSDAAPGLGSKHPDEVNEAGGSSTGESQPGVSIPAMAGSVAHSVGMHYLAFIGIGIGHLAAALILHVAATPRLMSAGLGWAISSAQMLANLSLWIFYMFTAADVTLKLIGKRQSHVNAWISWADVIVAIAQVSAGFSGQYSRM